MPGPSASPRVPKLRRHKPSGLAVVTIAGHDHYLGPWPAKMRKPPPSAKESYDALIAEWLAGGRSAPADAPALSVEALLDLFWKHAELHYRDADGQPGYELTNFKYSLRPLRFLYPDLPAADFGPLKLKAVRNLMVRGYTHPKYGPQEALSRGVVNARCRRIVRVFKWAVSEELVPESVWSALRTVRGLEKGRTDAREAPPVAPVALAHVEATLPFLNRHTAAMARLQLLTGMRPGEVCIMRASDIDRAGPVWLYRPRRHKTKHRGKERVIALGPRAQEVLLPFLGLDLTAYLFSPAAADAERRAGLAARR
jgi:integrase